MQDIKKSRYFRVNLGLANTMNDPKSGDRIFNERDKFQYFYNTNYKTTIYGQGNVGDIMFYVDHYIHDNVLALYLNSEEFIFEHDSKIVQEKGADFYIGHLIKRLETEHQERLKKAEEKDLEIKREVNPDLLTKNPGAVSYEDLQAYLKKKAEERILVQTEPKKE